MAEQSAGTKIMAVGATGFGAGSTGGVVMWGLQCISEGKLVMPDVAVATALGTFLALAGHICWLLIEHWTKVDLDGNGEIGNGELGRAVGTYIAPAPAPSAETAKG